MTDQIGLPPERRKATVLSGYGQNERRDRLYDSLEGVQPASWGNMKKMLSRTHTNGDSNLAAQRVERVMCCM